MDPISYSKAAQQEQRIKKIIAEPDSVAGLVSVPNLVPTGETITIPAGRTVVHPNLQVDGVLNVEGSLFVPAGGSVSETTVNTDVLVVDTSAILPSNTAIGSISSTELGYIDGVTSNIQVQLDTKQRMQLMTAQDCTSGTFKDFNGIPSWAKKITVMFNGVSTSGTSQVQVQLGDSEGIEAIGYVSTSSTAGGTALSSTSALLVGGALPSEVRNGQLHISHMGGNTFVSNSVVSVSTGQLYHAGGSKTLSSTLDRIRVTTVNGTDTFDAGQINVLYEG